MVALGALEECVAQLRREPYGLNARRPRAERRPAAASPQRLIDVAAGGGSIRELLDQDRR
ncbi:MAG: hypothetical protein ACHQC8_01140 [Solirubrobacterales bacterium]